jgi:hypothetical protein
MGKCPNAANTPTASGESQFTVLHNPFHAEFSNPLKDIYQQPLQIAKYEVQKCDLHVRA